MRFYLDTSIWMDFYEDRKGFNDEPIDEYAWKFLSIIKVKKFQIIVSDILMIELENHYSMDVIKGMFSQFSDLILKVNSNKEQISEAKNISLARQLPYPDALHAILSRDYSAILITRDNHFRLLKDIVKSHKPENFF